jgi:hypothetical protein
MAASKSPTRLKLQHRRGGGGHEDAQHDFEEARSEVTPAADALRRRPNAKPAGLPTLVGWLDPSAALSSNFDAGDLVAAPAPHANLRAGLAQ